MKRVYRVDQRKALNAADARRRRSRQKLPGPSEIGECRRRTAYRLLGQPDENPQAQKDKAIEGTIKHKVLLPLYRQEHGGQIEVRLLDREHRIEGSTDWIRQNPLDMWIVDDLKTYGANVYDHRIQKPVRPHVLYQLHLYADMLRRGKIHPQERRFPHKPIEIGGLELLERCRDDGRVNTRSLPYVQAIADEAWQWYRDVQDQVKTDGTAAYVPRDLAGPTSSDQICRNCPFVKACWGWDPETEERAEPLDLADPELLGHMQEYKKWAEVEADAKTHKARARAHLDGQPAQKVADWRLKWEGGYDRWIDVPDVDALVEKCEAAGIPVPMKAIHQTRAASVRVDRPARTKE